MIEDSGQQNQLTPSICGQRLYKTNNISGHIVCDVKTYCRKVGNVTVLYCIVSEASPAGYIRRMCTFSGQAIPSFS